MKPISDTLLYVSGIIERNQMNDVSGKHGVTGEASSKASLSLQSDVGAEANGIYIASRTRHAEKWRSLRAGEQYAITSSWIDFPDCTTDDVVVDLTELWCGISADIARSSGLLLYVESEDFPLRGALIEVGMMLSLGRPISVVAPSVLIDPVTLRPLGSWMSHPLITREISMDAAFSNLNARRKIEERSDDASPQVQRLPDTTNTEHDAEISRLHREIDKLTAANSRREIEISKLTIRLHQAQEKIKGLGEGR